MDAVAPMSGRGNPPDSHLEDIETLENRTAANLRVHAKNVIYSNLRYTFSVTRLPRKKFPFIVVNWSM
jgi:hypothetical protein